MLEEHGVNVLTIEQLLSADPIDPVETDEDDVALMQLTSGSTGHPKAVQITHRNLVSNAEAMFVGAEFDMDTDVIVSWLPLFHDMGMTGFLIVPMYFGAELVKITPMDFLRDTLLWAKLIDKYKGTMTAAPNFAYALFAKRLRRQANPASSTCPRCAGRCRAPNRWSPPTSRISSRQASRSGCDPRRSCPPMAWPKPLSRCRSRNAAADWSSTRSTPICWPSLRRAVPANKGGKTTRLATLGPAAGRAWRRGSSTSAGRCCPPRAVGVIEVRGEPVTSGYITKGGFIPTAGRAWLV